MDHHCPWINNCVGHYNHQYFELFVSYTFLGVSYFNLLMYCPFLAAIYNTDPAITREYRGWIVAVGSISFTCGVALLAFFVWNLYLVSSAQTTIEVAINSAEEIKVHPYDFGRAQNIRNFFGGRNWQDVMCLILIPQVRTPQGDGVTWDVRQECVGMMDDYEDMV
ncbi:hypothetical protein SARC_12248 [Sphaeroforma arctica JP610]|uniref:Palmitoyltransferase n=1 Tax=Sphaeroforma arctica JP610 TaxID=667725 RepID=A0A0L0FGQ4_9EUKA|nr:hypothetical protein SARC_12248 [Sphaeroforma arctica JP610]KNC75223.1 hypothetical protein SARC_12248 [Sphaeroforma arctica JP610]|eukprot:XP_014149125.1 hypothetical protein SARC_12248 [Sphaeroforma arctica JP610]